MVPDVATLTNTRRLWWGVLLAPAAWLVAEFGGYYAVSRGCEPGVPGVPLPSPSNPEVVQLVMALILAVTAAVGLRIAINNYRALPTRRTAGGPTAGSGTIVPSRLHFMAFAGVLVSALFLLGILFFALPPLLVGCSQAR